jgi:hypothetical protein
MIEPQAIKDNQSRMERGRASYDSAWGEIARLVYPEMDRFGGSSLRRSAWLRDQPAVFGTHEPYSTGALEDGVSVVEGYIMPRGQRWQLLELGDEDLMKKVHVQQWMDTLSRRLFGLRNDPQSGFVAATHDSTMALLSFGSQSMWIDDRWDHYGRWAGLKYESEFIGDIWIDLDGAGNVLRLHRKIALTAEQAWRRWGADAPPCVQKAMTGENPSPQTMLEFLHVIEPNRRFDAERIDMWGKPWHGAYYSCDDDVLFKHGGYHSLPRITSGWNRTGMSPWSRSPTMRVLPSMRMLMEIRNDRAWAAELRLKPPILTTDDAMDSAVLEIKPHGVTTGGLDDRGDPLFREFLSAVDATDAEKLQMECQQDVDRAFFRHLLQLNREYKSHIPANRIAEESAEKGILLTPLARQEQEWLSPMTMRELALAEERGLLDDMPGDVEEYLADNGLVGIKYDNGLAAMQEAEGSAAFLSLTQAVAPLAQLDPGYVEEFNRIYPPEKVISELGRRNRVPAAMQSTDDERAEHDRKKADSEMLQRVMDAAPALAGAAKDMATAGSIAA